jgi:hypothetical protein
MVVIFAEMAAAQMLSTFTSLRFGLMAGVGGDALSEDSNVRLGGVVVSRPTITLGASSVFSDL